MIVNFDLSQLEKINSLNPSKFHAQFDTISNHVLYHLAIEKLWPIAVNPHTIVLTPEQKKHRTRCILSSMIQWDMNDKKLLDFGCGDGSLVELALDNNINAIGYDPCVKNNTEFITNNWDDVVNNAPYDTIICYDSLDHVLVDCHDLFCKLADLLVHGGKMVMRLHPYTSIHGTHLYNTLNMAYIHLFLNGAQIRNLGGVETKAFKTYNPERYYTEMILKANLHTLHKFIVRNELPSFIDQNDMLDYLLPTFATDGIDTRQKLRSVLSIEFMDICAHKLNS